MTSGKGDQIKVLLKYTSYWTLKSVTLAMCSKSDYNYLDHLKTLPFKIKRL